MAASESPSMSPSISPSVSPSNSPSLSPSASISPSVSPSLSPSASISPSKSPSASPSMSPSASPSVAASDLGVVTVAIVNPEFLFGRNNLPCKIVVDCIASAAGTINAGIGAHYTEDNPTKPPLFKITGFIKKVETVPGLAGDLTNDLPSASYDITIKDEHGYDVVGGGLQNRSASAAEAIVPDSDIAVDSELLLEAASCGAEGSFRLIIFLGR